MSYIVIVSLPSLQKLHRETFFLQQQVSHMQHRSPPNTTTLQHQVGLFIPVVSAHLYHLYTCRMNRWLSPKVLIVESNVCNVFILSHVDIMMSKTFVWKFQEFRINSLRNVLLSSYRPDRQLQDIVYKMVPFLEECKYIVYTVRLISSTVHYVIFSLNSNVISFSVL